MGIRAPYGTLSALAQAVPPWHSSQSAHLQLDSVSAVVSRSGAGSPRLVFALSCDMSGSDMPLDMSEEAFVPMTVTDGGLSPVAAKFPVGGLTADGKGADSHGTRSGRQDWRRRKAPPVILPQKSPPQRQRTGLSFGIPMLSPMYPVSRAFTVETAAETAAEKPHRVVSEFPRPDMHVKLSDDEDDDFDRRPSGASRGVPQQQKFSPFSTAVSLETGRETTSAIDGPIVPAVRRRRLGANQFLDDNNQPSRSWSGIEMISPAPGARSPVSIGVSGMNDRELGALTKQLFDVADAGPGNVPPLPRASEHSSNFGLEAPGPSQQSLPDCLAVSTPGSLGDSGGNALFMEPKVLGVVPVSGVAPPLSTEVMSALRPVGSLIWQNGSLCREDVPVVSESKNHGTALETFQFGNSTMTASTRKELIRTQRTTNGLWCGSWAFPGQDHHGGYDTLDDLSCARCTDFMCHEIRGCAVGDCCSSLESVQVYKLRVKHGELLAGIKIESGGCRMAHAGHVLEQLILPFFDQQTGKWSRISLEIGTASYVDVCVSSYALILGYSGAAAAKAMTAVTKGEVKPCESVVRQVSGPVKGNLERNLVDVVMINQYIQSLQFKGECEPVPGGHRRKQTTVNKKSMKLKWEECQAYFRFKNVGETGYVPPGNKRMFKKLWKAQDYIKEKKMLANSKCTICARGDKLILEYSAPPSTPEKRMFLDLCMKKLAEHERDHLNDRSVLDEAAHMASVNKLLIWCLLVDAATQRNFILPKYKCRFPKNMAGNPEWNFSLMGVYAFGFGFRPFLAHDSVSHGSNYTWTAIWLVLCEMRDEYGRWPDILHLQFDNCSADNKNFITWAVCAWLVATGRVKQVRIFFLQVGHTHILIDQIFGVITSYLKGTELAFPQQLIDNIDNGLRENGQYMAAPVRWLHTLFSFNTWCSKELQVLPITHFCSSTKLNDEFGGYSGCYDFIIEKDSEKLAVMQYRERCSFPWWPRESRGVQVIRRLPAAPPPLAKLICMSKWGQQGSNDMHSMLIKASEHLRSLRSAADVAKYHEIWNQHLHDIKVDPCLMSEQHQLKFEHFCVELPRIEFLPPASAGETAGETDEATGMSAAEETAWAYKMLGIRDKPFYYDPIVSSEQSVTELASIRLEHELSCLQVSGPCIQKDTPLFLGRLLLAYSPSAPSSSSGVDLYKIESFVGSESPFDLEAKVKCSMFRHSPNPDVSGMWGETERLDHKQHCPVVLTRQFIVVYNVVLFDIITGPARKKVHHRYLDIPSLRALSRAAPLEYRMPDELPDTHVTPDTPPAQKHTTAPKQRRGAPNVGAKPKATGKKPAQPVSTASRKRQASETSSEDEEEEEGEEEDSESSGSSPGDDSESEEDEDDSDSDDKAADSAADREFLGTDFQRQPGVLELPQPTPELKKGYYGFANMSGDPDMSQLDFPVSPFYCEGTKGAPPDHLFVRYFHRPKGDRPSGKMVRGQYSPKTWTYPKFWVDPTFGEYKTYLRDSKKKKTIPEEYYLKNWKKELLHRQYVLNLEVPPESLPRDFLRVESLVLKMDFVMEKLLPALEVHL